MACPYLGQEACVLDPFEGFGWDPANETFPVAIGVIALATFATQIKSPSFCYTLHKTYE